MKKGTPTSVINKWKVIKQETKQNVKIGKWSFLGEISEDNFYYSNTSNLLKKNVSLNEV